MKKLGRHHKTSDHETSDKAVKYVTLKHKHKKPYLKRHTGSLLVLVLIGFVLIDSVLTYNARVQDGITRAQNFVSRMFAPEVSTTHTFSSTYGFKVSYDSQKLYASAVDTATGDLYFGDELDTKRDYDTVRISPVIDARNRSQNSLKMHIGSAPIQTANVEALLDKASQDSVVAGVKLTDTTVVKLGTQDARLDSHDFKLYSWELRAKTSPASLIPIYIASYVGVVDGRVVVININSGSDKATALYNDVLESLQFTARTHAMATPTEQMAARVENSRSLLDSALLAGIANAAAKPTVSGSERTTSLYSPAVLKIYNGYCLDVKVADKLSLTRACSAVTGSGFFVSSDGTIASNGHVVSSGAKDVVIEEVVALLQQGDGAAFNLMLQLSGWKDSDITSGMSSNDIADAAINKMYAMPDSLFVIQKSVNNLLVSLGTKIPDVQEFVDKTKNYQEYAEQDTIKRAKQVAIDYRKIDGIKAFVASDVSLIKIEGSNYPVVKLGSIDGLIQGSDLIILGFPGNASDNGIVSTEKSEVTLTAGKVSGIKNALGSTKKLIETDTTIGHGNSGGPALNSDGKVVGIATYTSDGSGKGNGTFNYIRDIQDLKDLAKAKSVSFSTTSTTQSEWEKGISSFYNSHYTSAVKSFQKVKKLYAAHPKADEFIAAANDHIKNGDDVKDLSIPLIAGGLLVVLIGIGVTIFLILRQRKLHGVYNDHLAVGTIAPMTPGATPVTVPMRPVVAGMPIAPMPAAAPSPMAAAMATPMTTPPIFSQPAAPAPAPAPTPAPVPTTAPTSIPVTPAPNQVLPPPPPAA